MTYNKTHTLSEFRYSSKQNLAVSLGVLLVVAGLFSYASLVSAAGVFVQQNYATPQSPQSSVSVTYNSGQTLNNTNVLVIGWDGTTSNITSVTDSAGNAYQVAVPTFRGSGMSQAIYYASVITPALLPAGNYWLAYLPSSSSLNFAVNFSIGSYKYATFNFGPMPATFPAITGQGTTHWSLYGTLTP